MRNSKWAVTCGVLGAFALGMLIGSIGGGRAVAQQGSSMPRAWPPAPTDIVSLPVPSEMQAGTSLGSPAYFYYEVPKDRALVVTDFIGGPEMHNTVYEDLPGKTSVKLAIRGVRGVRSEYHSAVGVSFAPGSKVLIANYGSDIHMTGYLTAP